MILLSMNLKAQDTELVSNVLNPLEEAVLPGNFSVSVADISAGKSKAWSSIKESILTLIREHERLRVENASLLQESSPVKQDQLVTKESDHLTNESNNSPQVRRQFLKYLDVCDKAKSLPITV